MGTSIPNLFPNPFQESIFHPLTRLQIPAQEKGKLGIIGLGPNLGFHETFPHFWRILFRHNNVKLKENTLSLWETEVKVDGFQSKRVKLLLSGSVDSHQLMKLGDEAWYFCVIAEVVTTFVYRARICKPF